MPLIAPSISCLVGHLVDVVLLDDREDVGEDLEVLVGLASDRLDGLGASGGEPEGGKQGDRQ